MESSAPTAAAGYEFGPAENATIAKAAKWIGFWSWVSIGAGVLTAIGSFFEGDAGDVVGGLIVGVVYVVIGVYYRGAAGSMRSVVDTEGDDVPHLMTALDKLASAFKVMGVLVIAGVVLALLAAVVVGGALALGA